MRTFKQPVSAATSVNGIQTVYIVDTSASSLVTAWSWCHGATDAAPSLLAMQHSHQKSAYVSIICWGKKQTVLAAPMVSTLVLYVSVSSCIFMEVNELSLYHQL